MRPSHMAESSNSRGTASRSMLRQGAPHLQSVGAPGPDSDRGSEDEGCEALQPCHPVDVSAPPCLFHTACSIHSCLSTITMGLSSFLAYSAARRPATPSGPSDHLSIRHLTPPRRHRPASPPVHDKGSSYSHKCPTDSYGETQRRQQGRGEVYGGCPVQRRPWQWYRRG